MAKIKFGVALSPGVWWRNISEFDRCLSEIEGLGYDGAFIPDHPVSVRIPYIHQARILNPLDCWVVLSYIAGKTESVRLGALVSPVPRYVPSQLAKMVATLDVLSNGRVIVGVGSGYVPEEFINYSPIGAFEPHKIRVERLREGLEIMIRLWTEDVVSFDGKYYKLKDAFLEPKPIQKPHPPLWSGVRGKLAIKVTAKYCNGWISPELRHGPVEVAPGKWEMQFLYHVTPEIYEENANRIKNYLKKYGRSVEDFKFILFGLSSGMAEDITKIEKFMQVGCSYWVISVEQSLSPKTGQYYEEYMKLLRNFAKNVMPSF
ncbi:MAG: LLM class flavin-dependent oxidoreductase [Candidatus Bathyarchaeia archaeon]